MKVVYVGRITEEAKQISKLTTAFCKIALQTEGIEFSIYGDGPEVESIQRIIEDFKIKDKVKYLGSVVPESIYPILSKHQVFSLLSDYEGMPVALMEAMACGLVPVCMAENSGINELIRNGENGLIVKDREESYFDAIKSLKQNPRLWQKLSSNAIETISKEYSAEITNKQWLDLLHSLLTTKPKRIVIPFRIKISDIPPMYYGDIRKPRTINRLKNNLRNSWNSFRMRLRPRSRLKKMLKYE
jgi:glycosyltransferase involved in cell wall biosynthesis